MDSNTENDVNTVVVAILHNDLKRCVTCNAEAHGVEIKLRARTTEDDGIEEE